MDVVGGEVSQGAAARILELDPPGPVRCGRQPRVTTVQRLQLRLLIGADPGQLNRLVDAGEGLRSADVAEAARFMLQTPRHMTVRDLVLLRPTRISDVMPGTEMRASFLDAPQRLSVRRTPVPDVGAHDVLVRVIAVGLCGSDVHFWEHGRVGDLVVSEPLILGHEVAGVIAEVGSEVARARVGQRVAVEPQRPCPRCRYCLTGRYNLCRDMAFPSAPPVH